MCASQRACSRANTLLVLILPNTMTMMDNNIEESLIEEPTVQDEHCKLLIQGLNTKDTRIVLEILKNEDPEVIKEILENLPAHHVRSLVVQLRNLISQRPQLSHLRWLQNLMTIKYSLVVSMVDGRSLLAPLLAILEDQTSITYFKKVKLCRGKIKAIRKLEPKSLKRKKEERREVDEEEERRYEEADEDEKEEEYESEEGEGEATTS